MTGKISMTRISPHAGGSSAPLVGNGASTPALLADIGGTNARFAMANRDEIYGFRTLNCADFPSLEKAAEAYLELEGVSDRPKYGAFALAGPVTGNRIRMTNLPWEFSVPEIRTSLGLKHLEIMNDFTAIALSVPHLPASDCVQIGEGEGVEGGVIGILGPGSGLGVSAVIPANGSWVALSTEGGHVTLPAITDREAAVLGQLRKQFDHISAERALCGPGLINLYHALCVIDGIEPLALSPAEICLSAIERRDVHCIEALDMFCAMLGTVAGNVALTYGARGGVYLAGGIAPKILPFLTHSRFRKRFVEKGRMRDYLGPIPTFVVTHPRSAFEGLKVQLFGQAA